MSLLQSLPYKDYQEALLFTKENCEEIARTANINNITFNGPKKPGEILIKALDRCGFSVEQYKSLSHSVLLHKKTVYYRPQLKIAVLIGNDHYKHLRKLATPPLDCVKLASKFKTMGFVVITLQNFSNKYLKDSLIKIFRVVPPDSYCVIFYAGHGCEICNIKCLLSVDCPEENIREDHFVTENFILNAAATCQPELLVILLDMCRVSDRTTNRNLFSQIPQVEDIQIHKNLLIGYSTVSSQSAYEAIEIECSGSIDSNMTYELKTGDNFVASGSQYAGALCRFIDEDSDVSRMMDKVHEEVENAPKKQRPVKLQCGVAKRSFRDPAKGNMNEFYEKLNKILKSEKNMSTILIS